MQDSLDIYTIIFFALAVFVLFRLRSVLGTRTGEERPPFDPFKRPEAPPPAQDAPNNVVPLPTANAPRAPLAPEAEPALDVAAELKDIADPASPLGGRLAELMQADDNFRPKGFIGGAKAAYEMIVLAYARGDRRALRDLLAKEVYDGFVGAINGREQRGEKVETTFVSLDKAEIVEAEMKGKTMNVTIRFKSQLITVTRDSAGKVIDGSPDKIADLADIWTFARDAGSRDPNWRLVSTEAAA